MQIKYLNLPIKYVKYVIRRLLNFWSEQLTISVKEESRCWPPSRNCYLILSQYMIYYDIVGRDCLGFVFNYIWASGGFLGMVIFLPWERGLVYLLCNGEDRNERMYDSDKKICLNMNTFQYVFVVTYEYQAVNETP